VEVEELGAEGEDNRCFSHALLHGVCRRGVGGRTRILLFFLLSFLCNFSVAYHIFLGQPWAEGKGELATCHLRADCGRENRTVCTSP